MRMRAQKLSRSYDIIAGRTKNRSTRVNFSQGTNRHMAHTANVNNLLFVSPSMVDIETSQRTFMKVAGLRGFNFRNPCMSGFLKCHQTLTGNDIFAMILNKHQFIYYTYKSVLQSLQLPQLHGGQQKLKGRQFEINSSL